MKRTDCVSCGRTGLDKNTVGINKKMLGTQIRTFYCMDCLADYLGTTTEALWETEHIFTPITRRRQSWIHRPWRRCFPI